MTLTKRTKLNAVKKVASRLGGPNYHLCCAIEDAKLHRNTEKWLFRVAQRAVNESWDGDNASKVLGTDCDALTQVSTRLMLLAYIEECLENNEEPRA